MQVQAKIYDGARWKVTEWPFGASVVIRTCPAIGTVTFLFPPANTLPTTNAPLLMGDHQLVTSPGGAH